MRNKILYLLGIAGVAWLARNLYIIFLGLPDEAAQGAIYRIMYFHVPSWWTCFAAYFVSGVAGVMYLVKKNQDYDALAVASVEVGVAFTLIGLATGSIWARIIWGIWWTWDARLTWALITCLVYAGYLMLRRAVDEPTTRARFAAVFGAFAFTTVAITWKSIEWWRTQHPGPVISFRTGGGNMDPAMENMLFSNWGAVGLIAIVLIAVRMRQEQHLRLIEALRRQVHTL
ncbi:MAG: cytochrome C assembly protein [Acidimicrobiia bacterium]|nr:cytochrome C assembly protein [Acidimicrobiia bacterium]